MYDFEYLKPGSLAEAATFLKANDKAKPLAGGMTLIPTLKQRLTRPSHLIDLGGLPNLSGIKASSTEIVVGAICCFQSFLADMKGRKLTCVHHHVSPPTFIKALEKYKLGERPMLSWSPSKSIEDMDRAGVSASISSITTPGVWFGDRDEARILARECNDYGAKLVRDFPGRFGLFASLPLPNIDDSLKEIEYAFGHLKADGVGIMTSFSDKWLGDPEFAVEIALIIAMTLSELR